MSNEQDEYDEQIAYYAQFQDWSGKWCNASPGTAYSASRDAVERAREMLGEAGYRDVSIRVVRVTQRRTLVVLQQRAPSGEGCPPSKRCADRPELCPAECQVTR